MTTTTNLSDFGWRELKMLEKLLKAYREQGLPRNFDNDEVVPMMNKNSGDVFLTNASYDVAMMNGDNLEKWHNCSYCGHEGFLEDFEHEAVNADCSEQMTEAGLTGHTNNEEQ
jgi:hypothetical protein